LFGFGLLHINDVLICFGAGLFSIMWFEIAKFIMKKKMIIQ
jgi:hypothetical protein